MGVELALLAAFSTPWLLVILANLGQVTLAGTLDLDLYRLFSVAAVLGWIAGNIYVMRSGGHPERFRRRLLSSYLLGPPSVIFALRLLAPQAAQKAAPLAPFYGLFVYALFFLVPLTLRATRRSRKKFRD